MKTLIPLAMAAAVAFTAVPTIASAQITIGPDGVREELLKDSEEIVLYAALREAEPKIAGLFRAGKYVEGGEAYAAQLGDPLHRFFDQVFVNVEDQALRANRMALLRRANRLFSSAVADLSRVVRPKS